MPAPMAIIKGVQVAKTVTETKAGRYLLLLLVVGPLLLPVVMVIALAGAASSILGMGGGSQEGGDCVAPGAGGEPANYTFTLPRWDPDPNKRSQTKNPNATPRPLPESYNNRGTTEPYAEYFHSAEEKYHVPWYFLAAISWQETNHGTSPDTWNRNAVSDSSYGPMQFIPGTWKTYGVDGDGDNVISDDSVGDQVHAAAYLLVRNGFLEGEAGALRAIHAYNPHEWYKNDVLFWAEKFAGGNLTVTNTLCGGVDSGLLAKVVEFVKSKVGFPYVLGAAGPAAFDCSGLMYAAYKSVGVDIARTAAAQADDPRIDIVARPPINIASLMPGDLLFIENGGPTSRWSTRLGASIGHVGMYIGNGEMVAASAPGIGVIKRKLGPRDFAQIKGVGRVKGMIQGGGAEGPWERPVTGLVTSGYGPRDGGFHKGLDIGAPCGTPMFAVADGEVTFAGPADGYGNYIVIHHGNNVSTGYGHEQALYVSVGQRVIGGQRIADVGNRGNSRGCHLHFEVHNAARGAHFIGHVDPRPVLAAHGVTYGDR